MLHKHDGSWATHGGRPHDAAAPGTDYANALGIPLDWLLTDRERRVVDLCAEVWNELAHVIASGPTLRADSAELAAHVHAIQNAVLSQAAARAFPSKYRLLGRVIR